MMIRRSLFIFGLLVLIFFQIPAASRSGNRPGLSLRETFDLYVKSVQGSNLEGLFSTVSEEETFFFLTSAGRLIATRGGYYKFHEEWFREKDWEMPVDHIEVHEGRDFGYVTAQYDYKGRTPAGGRNLLDSWFTLIFRKEGGMWKVVADVCTPISRTFQDSDSDLPISAEQKFLLDTLKNRRTVFPETRMKEFFRIPERYNLICFTPIGILEAWPQTPAKKALAEIVVFDKFD